MTTVTSWMSMQSHSIVIVGHHSAKRKSEIDLPSTAKPGDADQKTFFHTKDAMVYILGIGDASVFSVEKLRRNIFQAIKWSNDLKQKSLSIWFPNLEQRTDLGEAIGESVILSNYQFLKYKTKKLSRTIIM